MNPTKPFVRTTRYCELYFTLVKIRELQTRVANAKPDTPDGQIYRSGYLSGLTAAADIYSDTADAQPENLRELVPPPPPERPWCPRCTATTPTNQLYCRTCSLCPDPHADPTHEPRAGTHGDRPEHAFSWCPKCISVDCNKLFSCRKCGPCRHPVPF